MSCNWNKKFGEFTMLEGKSKGGESSKDNCRITNSMGNQ